MSDLSNLEIMGIIVGGLCAVGGLVLGMVNAYTQHARAKPRLVVRPGVKGILIEKHNGKYDDQGLSVVIEIHNVGNVPVQGSVVGFDGKKNWYKFGRKHRTSFLIKSPEAIDGSSWPRRLNPWDSVILKALFDKFVELEKEPGFKFARRVWVSTLVGDEFYSSRKDMRKFIKSVKERAEALASDSENA